MFLSLVCACLPVYRPILPSSVLLHQFFVRITSYAKNSRNKSWPLSNILGAEDGYSSIFPRGQFGGHTFTRLPSFQGLSLLRFPMLGTHITRK